MNFDLSEEQALLGDSASRYMRERYTFEDRRRIIGGTLAGPSPHWRSFADLGWLGLAVPEEFDGLQCSFVEMAIVLENLGLGLSLEDFVPSAVLCTRLIDASANDALRHAYLPKLASGAIVLALAHEEGASRDSTALPGAVATPTADGFRLHGSKTLALGAPSANELIVSARIVGDGAERLGLFLLEPGADGLSLDSYRLVDGRLAGDLVLENVHCGSRSLLAQGSAASDALDEALDWARLACMCESLGAIEGCLRLTSDYLKSRVQFGQPIGRFQSLQHLIAEMFVDAQESRSILYHAIAHLGDDAETRRRAIDAAKIVVGDAGRAVAAKGVQIHGGYGMTEEYPISHHYRQLFVLERLFDDVQTCLDRMSLTA